MAFSARGARRSFRKFNPLNRMETLEQRRLLAAAVDQILGPTAEDLSHQMPDWMAKQYLPATQSLVNVGNWLTSARPQPADPLATALELFRDRADSLSLNDASLETPFITSQYTDAHNGLTHIYLQQEYNGLPVINARANASVDKFGRVLNAHTSFIAQTTADNFVNRPARSAVSVLSNIASDLEVDRVGKVEVTQRLNGQAVRISAPNLSIKPIDARLVYVARPEGEMELAWHYILDMPGGQHWYELAASASSSQILWGVDYVNHATYRAMNPNLRSPYEGSPTVLTDPHNTVASPFGWHDTNGVAGAEFTTTRGNNVHSYLDRNNDNAPDTLTASGGASLDFNFTVDFNTSPTTVTTNQQAAMVNLFVANNHIHDVTYGYGFNEASGNFQTNNYGRGGAGNDAVNAEAQDGGGTNNANMATPADGSAPRMQMYIWNNTTPNRDGDFDQQIIYHEYTHGISNRLTGGPANSGALSGFQSGSMGEGWSDFIAIVLTAKPSDTAAQGVGMSPWALGQPANGQGIRTYRYSTDTTVNPFTANSINSAGGSVHYGGSVWATALWEVYWNLVTAYGFSSNLAGGWQPGQGGNKLALQLVLDGMKLQPVNPTFKQARDAILQADVALTGGQNQGLLWSAFAKRGFGFSFNSGTSSSSTTVVQAFDVPGQIGGKVMNDANDNGAIDAGETGLANIPVYLDLNNDSVRQTNEPQQLTDSIGNYVFNGLAANTYTVRVATPAGQRQTSPASSYSVVVSGPNAVNVERNFTLTNRARISGFTYNDRNWSNSFDPSDAPLANQRVFIDSNNSGTWDNSSFDLTNTTPLSLPDDRTTRFSNFDVSTTGTVGNLSLRINLSHTFIGDLDTYLISPSGTRVLLFSRQGSTSNGFNGTLSMTAANSVTGWPTSSTTQITGDWRPQGDFSAFNGQNLSGTWRIEVTDQAGGDFGSLDSWALVGGSSELSTLSDANGAFTLPNLNSGSVNLRQVAQAAPWVFTNPSSGARTHTLAAAELVQSSFGQRNSNLPVHLASNFLVNVPQGPRMDLTFSSDVILGASSFSVINVTTNTTIPSNQYSVSFNPATKIGSISFAPVPAGLPDGQYRLVLNNSITNTSGFALANPGIVNFNFLRGDFDVDGTVGFNDLLEIARNYGMASGATYAQGDANYDGAVNFSDLLILARKYGSTLPADFARALNNPYPTNIATTPSKGSAAASRGSAFAGRGDAFATQGSILGNEQNSEIPVLG
jgi:extracellular elastinolytic metalloproteinase